MSDCVLTWRDLSFSKLLNLYTSSFLALKYETLSSMSEMGPIALDDYPKVLAFDVKFDGIERTNVESKNVGFGFPLVTPSTKLAKPDDGTPWEAMVQLTLSRNSFKNHTIGFCLFDQISGSFVDASPNGTGNLFFEDSINWSANSQKYSVWSGSITSGTQESFTPSFLVNGNLDPSSLILVPYIVAKQGRRLEAFTTFSALNNDKREHFLRISDNTLAFEDSKIPVQPDFNDASLTVNSIRISSPRGSSANWMSMMPDRTRLFDMLIPGTHDSATFNYKSHFYDFVVTQDWNTDIREQLNNGIRFFDFRFYVNERHDLVAPGDYAKNLSIYHKYDLDINLKEVLDPIKEFLEANPSEVVFVSLQPDPKEVDGHSVIYADYLRGIYNEYKINKSLPSKDDITNKTGFKFNDNSAEPNNLFVEGWKDFETIRQLRPYKGLGNLAYPKYRLVIDSKYNNNTPILDPRADATLQDPEDKDNDNVILKNPRLNYSGLALGDVRGKIILVESFFKGYPRKGWVNENTEGGKYSDINVNPLDSQGVFSQGRKMQDNWDYPSLSTKLKDIYDFATAHPSIFDPGVGAKQLPLNFTSASGPRVPASYAHAINSASTSNEYSSDTLSSWLKRKSPYDNTTSNGSLTEYNLNEKLVGKTGLTGILAGDFYTASKDWYGKDFDLGRPIPSQLYTYTPSDWLTSQMWRQNAILTPKLLSNNRSFSDLAIDPITGIPAIQKHGSMILDWNQFLGVDTPEWAIPQISVWGKSFNLKHRLTMVSAGELGLTEEQRNARPGWDKPTKLAITSPDNIGKETVEVSFNRPGDSYDMTFTSTSVRGQIIQDIGAASGSDSHFFKVELIAERAGYNQFDEWDTVGSPTFFAIV